MSKTQWVGVGLLALALSISAMVFYPWGQEAIIDDGYTSISTWNVNTTDLIAGGSVTADAADARLADGSVVGYTTLAAGVVTWSGHTIREGEKITVQIDSSTNYYPIQQDFIVGDIEEGDTGKTAGFNLGTVQMWGMDPSSDAGVVQFNYAENVLYNGTGTEDTFTVDADTLYPLDIKFNWNGATDEYWGVEQYTDITGKGYTYIPVIKIITSTGCIIEDMSQVGYGELTEHYNIDNGDNVISIWQIEPMREDEDEDEGIYLFEFNFTPDDASGDTIDITFHDETRLDRCLEGKTSQAAVETVAQITTA